MNMKLFLQLVSSILLILLTIMTHYNYYKTHTDLRVYYTSATVLLIGFLGLYYSMYGLTVQKLAIGVFGFVYICTLYHLYDYTKEGSVHWKQLSSLWMILAWLVFGYMLHMDPKERMYIMGAIILMLYAWISLLEQCRKSYTTDHPSYMIILLCWIFIAYRLAKIDY